MTKVELTKMVLVVLDACSEIFDATFQSHLNLKLVENLKGRIVCYMLAKRSAYIVQSFFISSFFFFFISVQCILNFIPSLVITFLAAILSAFLMNIHVGNDANHCATH